MDKTKSEPREIQVTDALSIWTKKEPRGKFFYKENGASIPFVVGIDNSTGEAFTGTFETEAKCRAWLEQESGGKILRNRMATIENRLTKIEGRLKRLESFLWEAPDLESRRR